jgi:hypothetical protein
VNVKTIDRDVMIDVVSLDTVSAKIPAVDFKVAQDHVAALTQLDGVGSRTTKNDGSRARIRSRDGNGCAGRSVDALEIESLIVTSLKNKRVARFQGGDEPLIG